MLSSSLFMVVFGGVLSASGIGLVIYGVSLNNNDYELLRAALKGSGYPGTAWIVFGVFLMLCGLALMTIGLLRGKERKKDGGTDKIPPPTGLIRCARCGTNMPPTSLFCPNCGAQMAAVREEPAPVREAVCPFCENILSPDSLFCPACGNPVAPGEKPVPIPFPPTVEKRSVGGMQPPTDDDL